MNALYALAVELDHSLAHEADWCGLLLVRQNLHAGQSGGIVKRNVHTDVAKPAEQPW
jgi:hypothetical protein